MRPITAMTAGTPNANIKLFIMTVVSSDVMSVKRISNI